MIGDCCVCLFIKIPEQNNIKNFKSYLTNIENIVKKLKNGNYCFSVSFYPKEKEKSFKKWLGDDIGYIPQIGKDINSKMKNIFIQAFSRGYKFVILLNCEKIIDKGIVEEALCDLEECDAVIGKDKNGSFYLIGFKNSTFLPEILLNAEINSKNSYNQILENLKEKDYLFKELPVLQSNLANLTPIQ